MRKLRKLLLDFIGPFGVAAFGVFLGGIPLIIIGYNSTTIWGSVIRICGYVVLVCGLFLIMESIRIMKKMRSKE